MNEASLLRVLDALGIAARIVLEDPARAPARDAAARDPVRVALRLMDARGEALSAAEEEALRRLVPQGVGPRAR